jgi:cell division protein ZapA
VSEKATTVSVRILDKEYQVACPADQVDELTASARYLDQQMRTIRDAGKVLGVDRIAVMAALNISHDLLRAKQASRSDGSRVERKLSDLHSRLDRVLAEQKQLAL